MARLSDCHSVVSYCLFLICENVFFLFLFFLLACLAFEDHTVFVWLHLHSVFLFLFVRVWKKVIFGLLN